MHTTIFDSEFKLISEDYEFDYQKELTAKLDNLREDFDQNILNEIVLWKVNRYAGFSKDLISEINSILPNEKKRDNEKVSKILFKLLGTKGVQLPMASTILRYKNPNIFQIIDQRVFRIIYPAGTLKLSAYKFDNNIKSQIHLYFKYLDDLKNACDKLEIPFKKADRILFMADRRLNKEHRLKNY